jgi:organic hydroperoxide reductase OsmC/OhrA
MIGGMSDHHATIDWNRDGREFPYEAYSRDHTWSFAGGVVVNASAAPAYKGNPDLVDPEEAFVASLSSCHMLTFLALAAKAKLVVDRYSDHAVARMEKNDEGQFAVTAVTLNPVIEFDGRKPEPGELARLHDKAHHMCFIANSVKTRITVTPPTSVSAS